ncbi:MAG: hypothetical protein M1347_02335 [Chloroflexi bacterium]|nr:hypothetical protein [Chloroflexota bacterium]
MKNIAFFRMLLGSLFLVLLLGAVLPITALADGGNPPADPAPTDTTSVAESSNDEADESEVVSIEPSSSEELPELNENAASDAGGTAAADVNEISSSVELDVEALPTDGTPTLEEGEAEIAGETANEGPNPENVAATILEEEPVAGQPEDLASIEIAVADETGEALPLASEAAAEILASGDPIWCPVSVAVPKPNSGGCTASFTSLADLFAELTAHPKNVDGTIWIEKDYSSGVDATLDGANINLATMRNFKLTLKGGWNGCGVNPPATCVGTIDTLSPSEITHQVNILAWNNDVTLSDLLITDVSGDGSALSVATTGTITLTRVEVSDNDGPGARLDNTAGTKDISITASTFNNNADGDGLNVTSNGLVTLKDVEATHNGAGGASINNVSLTLKNVTLLGTNVFSENLGHGLEIRSSGQVNLSNLVNNVNGNYGLWIDNSSSTKTVIISGTNEFKFNGGGLKVLSNGAITINNITATNNSVFEGALIDNSGGLAANVALTGTNVLNFNQLDGLHILSKGVITLNKTTASDNGLGGVNGYGAWLDNSDATSARAIVINTGTFSDNLEGGLLATSKGAITISKLVANGNEGTGAELSNLGADPLAPQNIVLTGSVAASLNEGAGLDIHSLGAITLALVTANGNQGDGAILTAAKSVTITGTSSFNENGAAGLSITSKGWITLSNITANSNIDQGVLLDNNFEGSTGNVSINGVSEFSKNHKTGLQISTRGSVLITNLHALGNLAKGVAIDNSVDGFQGSVTVGTMLLNWCNEISLNASSGLEISSNGTVTLTNVCASGNGRFETPGYGAVIDNSTANSPKAVVLNGVNSFTDNYTGGIQILSNGSIKVANLTASNSIHGFGATLDNASDVNKPQSITFTGFNQVSANYGNGLTVTTYGAVLINNLTASSNGANGGSGYGAWLDNCNMIDGECNTVTPQSITLTGRNSFSSNMGNGLKILGLGAIMVNNVGATSNSGTGAILNNDFDGAVGGITITGTFNVFSNNANGLEGTSRRAISISNLEASSNTGYGASLSNYANPPSPQGITITGYAIFDDNGSGHGLFVRTWGAITIQNLSASNNGAQGATLDNAEAGATGAVTLTGIQTLVDNDGSGLEIISNRAVTISNITASLNNNYGLSIDNKAAGLVYDVTLTGSNTFSENDRIGLDIRTYGAITLNNITANKNGLDALEDFGYGAYLDNQTGATTAKPITLTGANTFNENFEDGLLALSLGQIKVNSLSAIGNSGDGVNLDNRLGTAGIALTGVNNFQDNAGYGLLVLSRGSISVVNLTANLNRSGGAKVDNSGSSFAATVSISGINTFSANGTVDVEGAGLLVKSRSTITLSNLTADGNLFYGVQLDNQTNALGTPSISLTGVNSFSGNRSTGLFVQAGGDVNLSKLVADGNTGDGLFVASVKNVSLTCGSLTANEGTGVTIYALTGTVTLKGVFAYGNDDPLGGNSDVHAGKLVTSLGCPLK